MKGYFRKSYKNLKRFDKAFIIPLSDKEKEEKEKAEAFKKKFIVIDKQKAKELVNLNIIKIY